MTIDEAIEYYIKAATQRAIADEEMGVNDNSHWNETKFMTKKQSEQIIADNRQFAEWLTELKEAKRLLKLAVEDLSCGGENSKCTKSCKTCTHNSIKGHGCRYYGEYHWRYTDEALKLIEEEAP